MRFKSIWPNKWPKKMNNEENMAIIQEWSESLSWVNAEIIKSAIEYCKLNYEWPPDLHSFTVACDNAIGMPTTHVSFENAVKRIFDHPVTKLAFIQIGEWEFNRAEEKKLIKIFEQAYKNAACEYRNNREYYDEWFKNSQEDKKECFLEKKVKKINLSLAKFYILQTKKMMGNPLNMQELEEIEKFKENVENVESPYKSLTNAQIYDKIREEKREEAMRVYHRNQSRIDFKVNETIKSSNYKNWISN